MEQQNPTINSIGSHTHTMDNLVKPIPKNSNTFGCVKTERPVKVLEKKDLDNIKFKVNFK